jgi:hypothetical protein
LAPVPDTGVTAVLSAEHLLALLPLFRVTMYGEVPPDQETLALMVADSPVFMAEGERTITGASKAELTCTAVPTHTV